MGKNLFSSLIILIISIFFIACGNDEETNKLPFEYSFIKTTDKPEIVLKGDIQLDFINDEIPGEKIIQQISEDIIRKNPNYENFFFSFNFPFEDERTSFSTLATPYYLVSKEKDKNLKLEPLYLMNSISFKKITINPRLIGKLGITPISKMAPIELGISVEKIKERFGDPTFSKENSLSYFIVNNQNQMLGVLKLGYNNDKISEIIFYSNNIMFSKNKIQKISSYILGEIKLENLNIKEIDNIK